MTIMVDMKKYTQILAVLVVFTLLVIAKQGLSSSGTINLGEGEGRSRVIAPSELPTPAPIAIPVRTAAPVSVTTPTTTPQGKYKNGTYTGSVADAYYGYVQVQAIISGGKIVDVKFLQYPNDNSTSISINSQAMPYLTQEAIQAQSARVNTVTGASATSDAFVQSLQNALKQAV